MEEEITEEEVEKAAAPLPDSVLGPRQRLIWKAYISPKSATFGNCYRSALATGYSDTYARKVSWQPWFKAKLRRMNMVNKAEKVMDITLDLPTAKLEADKLRVQTDVAKFIAKTLGKDEGYSERQEVTGANGNPIVFMPAELMAKYNLDKAQEEELETNTE